MAHMGRPGLSAAQKADLWQRWKQGQSLSEIGLALGKHAGSTHGVVSSNGGFIPVGRRRSHRVLTLAEREEISRVSRQIVPSGRSPPGLVAHPRPSAVKSPAVVGPTPIAPRRPMRRPGHTRAAPSPVGSPRIPHFSTSSRAN